MEKFGARQRVGGTYRRESPKAKPTRIGGTEEHPEGNRARSAKGVPLDKPRPAPAPTAEPSSATASSSGLDGSGEKAGKGKADKPGADVKKEG
ncbi:hypothetical protein SAMN06265365_14844 [Tistlia consotensis]|uniref:Uncharacterized protein n=1 Tax=Tistlia consotensis USBA 355 TaxID=560819 RepID=A0A1Y6CXA1_9PROT|nr:hypothetical protein [Tistlia consotensis]SMF83067.1 hypothetical protein SAMN05428998_14845 [Tistlia consotensis USBA 355]SNS31949.1 hypothetical protein SAMN06265365_14844 [Tistlia consotensis]